MSAHRSTVCLIEDVHWADEATLQLLSHLAARIDRYRVLLVLTARSDDLRRDPLVLAHVGKITRLAATTRIVLQPLDAAGVAHLVDLTLSGRRRSRAKRSLKSSNVPTGTRSLPRSC